MDLLTTVPLLAQFGRGFDHMMGGWMWGAWIFGMIFWLAVLALIVVAIWRLAKGTGGDGDGGRGGAPDSALEILRRRYATGEIDREEFEGKKRDLGYG